MKWLKTYDTILDAADSVRDSIKSLSKHFDKDYLLQWIPFIIALIAAVASAVYSLFTGTDDEVSDSFDAPDQELEGEDNFPVRAQSSASTTIKTTRAATAHRTVKDADIEIQKIKIAHPTWVVNVSKRRSPGRYPGCPSSSIVGRIEPYEYYILHTINYILKHTSLDINAVCGLVGGLMHESGLLPCAFNRSAGGYGAQGIAQWRQWNKTGPDKGRIGKYVELYGIMPVYDSLEHQLEYVCWEINNVSRYRPRNGMSLYEAAKHAFLKYEGASADPKGNFEARYRNAKKAYSLYSRAHQSRTVSSKVSSVKQTSRSRSRQ